MVRHAELDAHRYFAGRGERRGDGTDRFHQHRSRTAVQDAVGCVLPVTGIRPTTVRPSSSTSIPMVCASAPTPYSSTFEAHSPQCPWLSRQP